MLWLVLLIYFTDRTLLVDGTGQRGQLLLTRCVRPAARSPRRSTAPAHPAPELGGEEPPRSAARSRWPRCHAWRGRLAFTPSRTLHPSAAA
jgi:hypothetical protein